MARLSRRAIAFGLKRESEATPSFLQLFWWGRHSCLAGGADIPVCRALVMVLLAVAWAPGQATRPASGLPASELATRPASTQPAWPDPDSILRQLDSPDWRQRVKARDLLIDLGEEGKPFISDLIRRATTDEARNYAEAALARIDENRVLGPSFITLHLKDAAPAAVFAELSRQCFAPLTTMPDNLWETGGFPKLTLDVDHKPFWEVAPGIFSKLGVDLRQWQYGMRIMRTGGMQMQQGISQVKGPFLVTADQVSYSRTRSFGPGRAQQSQFGINLSLYPEPKIVILGASNSVRVEEAIDDRGNSLAPPEPVKRNYFPGWGGYGGWNLYVPLQYPKKNIGSRIVRFKGTTSLQIQTKAMILEIPNVMSVKEMTKVVSGVPITFKELKKTGDAYELHMMAAQPNLASPEWPMLMRQLQTRLELVDGRGDVLDHRGMSSTGNNNFVEMSLNFGHSPRPDNLPAGDPVKLVWEVPTESKSIELPIEFHDLPLFEEGK